MAELIFSPLVMPGSGNPGAIASGKYTIPRYVDSQFEIPELGFTDSSNYAFSSGIDISN